MLPKKPETTHFGFREVATAAKTGMVRNLFTGVAGNYDVMNDLMSFGAHRIWKSALVDWLAPRSGHRILDLAGGTGDVALRILKRSPDSTLTILDLTEEMMAAGRQRAKVAGFASAIDWIAGDALAMPFPSSSFDVCVIAFGLRNFGDINCALAEIHRILKVGGRLLVLEFSEVNVLGLRRIYDSYSFHCIPELGHWVARDRDSYRYLVESIRRFPRQRDFAIMIEQSGFEMVKFRNLSMGIVAIHSGWKV